MPLKLVPPRIGKTPFYAVRGTHCGVYLDRSTKFTAEAKARAQLRAWRDEIESGRLSGDGTPTFLDGVVAYVKAGGDDRFLGSYDDETGLWSGLAAELGPLPMPAIDQTAIDAAAAKLLPKAGAPTRNRQVYTPVSAVLKQAGVDFKIKRPKGWRGTRRVRFMQPEEAFRLLAAARKVDAEFGAFLTVLLYTGVRLSEGLRLRCERSSLAEAWSYIERTKNGEPRTVFLPPAAVAALASHRKGMDRIGPIFRFRKNGRIYALMSKAKAKAGLDLADVSFHTFRHTWATWMRRYGGLDTTGLVATDAWRDRTSAARYEHVSVSEEARKAILLPVENPGTTQKNRRKWA